MANPKPPEVWLRGPVAGVPPLLQPVAHALLQAREELSELLAAFPDELLWQRPGGVAAVGFHLQHLRGVLDRLFTYARGEQLSAEQLSALKSEGVPDPAAPTTAALLAAFHQGVERALDELKTLGGTDPLAPREVGRSRLPSTVQGLLFHAAEHTMRHTGQLLVTARILMNAPAHPAG